MLNSLRSFSNLMMHLPGSLMSRVLGQKKSLSRPSEYQCQACDEVKPLTSEYFQAVKNFKYGYSTYCNECDKKVFKKKDEE